MGKSTITGDFPGYGVFFSRNRWEFHHPNWRTPSFFQRSRSTTNQRLILLEVLAMYLCFTEESAEEPWFSPAEKKRALPPTFSEAVTTKFARPRWGFGVCLFHCWVVTGTMEWKKWLSRNSWEYIVTPTVTHSMIFQRAWLKPPTSQYVS